MNVQPTSIIDVARKANIAKNINPQTAINGGRLSYTFATDAFKASMEGAAKTAEKTGILGKAAKAAKNIGGKVLGGIAKAGKAILNGTKTLLGKTPVAKAFNAVKEKVGGFGKKVAIEVAAAGVLIANSKPVQLVKGLVSKLPGVAKKAV